jgi:hypothetical protein
MEKTLNESRNRWEAQDRKVKGGRKGKEGRKERINGGKKDERIE